MMCRLILALCLLNVAWLQPGAPVTYKECEQALQTGDFERARQKFEELRRQKSTSADPKDRTDWDVLCRFRVAICKKRLGQPGAIEDLSALVAKHEKHELAQLVFRELGEMELKEWKLEPAILHLKKALELAKIPTSFRGSSINPSPLEQLRVRGTLASGLIRNNMDDEGKKMLTSATKDLAVWKSANAARLKDRQTAKIYKLCYVNQEAMWAEIARREDRTADCILKRKQLLEDLEKLLEPDDELVVEMFNQGLLQADSYKLVYRFADARQSLELADKCIRQLADAKRLRQAPLTGAQLKSRVLMDYRDQQEWFGELKNQQSLVLLEEVRFKYRQSLDPADLLPTLSTAEDLAIAAQQHYQNGEFKNQVAIANIFNTLALIELERADLQGEEKGLKAHERALGNLNRSIEYAERSLQKEHDVILMSRARRAWILWKLNRAEPAHLEATEVLKLLTKKHGADWLNIAVLHASLIDIEASLDNLPEARIHAEAHRRLIAKSLMPYAARMTAAELSRLIHDLDEAGFHSSLRLGISDPALGVASAEWLLNGKARETEAFGESSRRAGGDADFKKVVEQQAYDLYGQPLQREALDKVKRDLAMERKSEDVPWRLLKDLPLQADEVLVDFFCLKDVDHKNRQYCVWVITGPAEVQVVQLGDAEKIDELIRAFTEKMEGYNSSASNSSAGDRERDLKEELLEPLSKLLLRKVQKAAGPRTKWVVSPDGPLWNLPWPVLLTADGKYAVESLTFRYVVSGRDLLGRTAGGGALGPSLLLIAPDYGKADPLEPTYGQLPQFEESKAEGLAVFDSLKGQFKEGARLRMGKEATKQAFFDNKLAPRLLYFATHGLFRDQSGSEDPFLSSGIALAGGNNVPRNQQSLPGFLTAAEVLYAPVKGTELVVLSACQTSRGVNDLGNSSSSLRHAFHLAGARSVVGSLWTVPAEQTGVLMGGFMRNIADGQDKAEALRQAQLALIGKLRQDENQSHPYFWAAFTLSGF